LACCLIAALFLYAGLMKFFALLDGRVAADTIFGAFSRDHPALAWTIIGLEMAVGGALLLPQAGTSVLATANATPQTVLSLLGG